MVKHKKPRPHAFALIESDAAPALAKAVNLIFRDKITQKDAYAGLVADLNKQGTANIPSYSAFNRFVRHQVGRIGSQDATSQGQHDLIGLITQHLNALSAALPAATLITLDASRPEGKRVLIRMPARQKPGSV